MALSPHVGAGDFFLKLRIWYIPPVPLQGLQRAGKVMPCANVKVWFCILKEILKISRKKKMSPNDPQFLVRNVSLHECWRALCPLEIHSLFKGQMTEWKGICVYVCPCVCVLGGCRGPGTDLTWVSAPHRKEHYTGSLEVWFAGWARSLPHMTALSLNQPGSQEKGPAHVTCRLFWGGELAPTLWRARVHGRWRELVLGRKDGGKSNK